MGLFNLRLSLVRSKDVPILWINMVKIQIGLSKQCRPRSDAQNVASGQGLHCLLLVYTHLQVVKWTC